MTTDTVTIPEPPVCDWCDKLMTFDKFVEDFCLERGTPTFDAYLFECKHCETWQEVAAE